MEVSFGPFSNFNILPDPPSDHYFLNIANKLQPHNVSKYSYLRFMKMFGEHPLPTEAGDPPAETMYREWKILEDGLPCSIFVNVYKSRINIMRAAIMGAEGTPYSNGLFFFDIFFPSSYPDKPPLVYFNSYGLHVNPNLNKNGYVCLSLLDTWAGVKEKKWNNAESTVLQVLVSIQPLVSNAEPYFIDPFQNGSPEASRSYNVFLFKETCTLAIHTLKDPPKDFKNLVNSHFREKGRDILMKFRAAEYVPVFKEERKLFYKLVEALESIGVNCKQLVIEAKNKKGKSIFKKIWSKIKDVIRGIQHG